METAESSVTTDHEPIAIIGMSCRLPGAHDPDALWDMVVDRREGVAEYPGGRTPELDAFYRRAGMPDGPASNRGGFLPDIDRFDAAFFEISPREAEWLDPQQRLLLEAAWEALEDAGLPLTALSGEKAGVFVGAWVSEYERHATAHAAVAEFFLITGGPLYGASSRIAYQFDLRGPDVCVNAACGSSLVAIHLAVRSLRSGESSVALAGGVNALVRHELTQAYSRSGMLSPDGRCKFGDATADGFVRSDGVGMLVLKRLSDAQRDGDRVLALIRGTAIANDGRGSGLLATPSAAGQRQAMLDALADAGLTPESVDYVEAHGTGTRAGDPIEVSAIASVFGRHGDRAAACRTGSVKSNVGHTESAAGVASILRVVQALRHRWFPATLHVKDLNPAIDWEAAGVTLEREGCAWEKQDGAPRRASVNGLGLTGTNAHVVLEEAPEAVAVRTDAMPAYILPVSAVSGAALEQRARDLSAALGALEEAGGATNARADFCYTASVRRNHLPHRLAVVGADSVALQAGLDEFIAAKEFTDGRKPKIAFVFPGQGSQWVGMGRELLRTSAPFRRSIEASDAAIHRETGWSVLQQLQDSSLEERLARIDVVQPTLFAVEVALGEVWKSWGVVPEGVVGHSMGEIAAACVAGILSLEDAAAIICRRSALLMRVAGAGAMVVVDLAHDEAQRCIAGLEDRVSVAVSNSPRSTVLAGDPATLDGIVATLEQQEVFCRWVRVDVASHSPQMDPLTGDLFAALATVQPRAGSIPMCSTVRVGMTDPAGMDGAYWVDNLRQPVRFASAIEALLEQGFDTFLEMSPHAILLPFVEQTAGHCGRQALAMGSLRRNEPETATLLASMGRLYTAGAEIAWEEIYPAGNLVKLPAYPWQRERFWMESAGRPTRGFAAAGGHPLAGVPLHSATGEWIWSAKVTADAHAWLKDHAVGGTVLLPASAYIEMAASAAKTVFAGDAALIENLLLGDAAVLGNDGTLDLQLVVTPESPDAVAARFFHGGAEAGEWVQAAECVLRRTTQEELRPADLSQWQDAEFSEDASSGSQHAERMADLGYRFGSSFRRMDWLTLTESEALARVELPFEFSHENYLIHPAILDAPLQVLARLLIEKGGSPEVLLPVAIESVKWRAFPVSGDALFVRAVGRADGRSGDIDVFDSEGGSVVAIRGLVFESLADSASQSIEDSLYEVSWERRDVDAHAVAGAVPGEWLLVGDHSGFAADLAEALRRRGASVAIASPAAILHEGARTKTAVHGVVWLTPGELDDNAKLSEAQQVLADGAGIVSKLADFESPSLRMWLLTRSAQSVDSEPVTCLTAAGAWGFFASISNEYPALQASCIDLPAERLSGESELVAAMLLSGVREDRLALRRDGWFCAKLIRFASGSDSLAPVPESKTRLRESEGFTLVQRVPGSLDSFELVAVATEAPGDEEVEIEVEAAGLNFRDVLQGMAVHEGLAGSCFGGECAGTVVRAGKNVTRFRTGDAVLAITSSFEKVSMFASRVRVHETLVAKKPEQLSFVQAAGIPCVFLTAWYALVKLARLEKGERVLIHAAAGGVGLAAIQVANWIGAEIYATAGSEEKREYLQGLGIQRIMHSRKLDFAHEIMHETGGQGVDVVLNSLAGPAISKGLESLGAYGRFVEIGRRDILENTRIGLQPFEKNLSMFAVELAQSVEDRREMVGAMLAEVMDLFRAGVFQALPSTLFPVSAAGDAFQLMARGGHIGKIVLDVQNNGGVVRRDASRLAADATYLITGGLGGLGLVTARTLVEQGARHLVLVSRRAASEGARQSIAELEVMGATVSVRSADVSLDADVGSLLDEIGRKMPPLRGIVHAAGILDDAVISGLTLEKFESVMAGKVNGALALNARMASLDLDFLVYFSSVAGLIGTPGQANYAAANAMLDGLAHQQRARGIPAISINWGTWKDVGLAAAEDNRGARMAGQGLSPLTPSTGAALLMRILGHAPAQVAAMHFEADQWCASHPAAARSLVFADLISHSGRKAVGLEDLPEDMGALDGEALMEWLRKQVAAVLRMNPDRVPEDKPLRSLGLDSLMALELRNRMERSLRLKLSATLVWNYPTIATMAEHLRTRLAAAPSGTPAAGEKSTSSNGTKPLTQAQGEGSSISAAEMLEMELLGAESLLRN